MSLLIAGSVSGVLKVTEVSPGPHLMVDLFNVNRVCTL